MKNLLACNRWLYKVFPMLRWWPMVNRQTLRDDAMAGLTGALIVLPQGVAFATIAGLPPEYGLYAAMVPAVIGALFGSSWHLVSGPTTAISIVVFASLHEFAEPGTAEYIKLVLTLTFLVGLFQLILGVARLGALVNFISHTVVIGFTAGAAVLIAASQIKNFFGIALPRGASFVQTFQGLYVHAHDINWYAVAVGVVTIVVGIAVKRWFKKFPYMIAAMVAGGGFAALLNYLYGPAVVHIATVGALKSGLPPFSAPDFSLGTVKVVATSALAVTLLALTEAVSIARALAAKSGQRIDGNQEFIGQGLSNIFGSFFSSYASSGSFNRSGLNYSAGAKTPLAAVFASITLIIVLLLIAPLAAYLPIPSMAGILFLVAYGLIDFHEIAAITRASRPEAMVLFVTLFAALFLNLEVAIYSGVMLSLMLYLNRTAKPHVRSLVPSSESFGKRFVPLTLDAKECPYIKLIRVEGSIFFGAVNHVGIALQQIQERNPEHRHVVLIAKGVNFVDVAGAELLAHEAKRLKAMDGRLYLTGIREDVCAMLKRTGAVAEIGEENIFQSKGDAIAAAYQHLAPNACLTCEAKLFRECRECERPAQPAVRLPSPDAAEFDAITHPRAI